MRNRMRRQVPAVLVLVTALALTGCANPIEQLVERGVSDLIDEASGGEVQIGGITGGNDVPSDFPASVPLPAGNPDSALRVVNDDKPSWTLHYSVGLDTFEQLRSQIVAAGFDEETSGDVADVMRMAQYTDGTLRISLALMGGGDEALLQLMVAEL